ncbi:hypothetical protein BOTBODRAFT_164222 [Botryobasidium botryosum FD-172 SS1]|uniref:Superkiller protein 3 n=1 Tax=Botryobasidium botryosum (strain FD-172 SS1) TaxID=930990 RepID=A0A067ME03_BOTB1|nr:hypothetical protein BOTBODRAFT_164222 [Botryobasidium botryosum FD-172 SS1]
MASIVKNKLKAARDALGKKNYQAAQTASEDVISYEPSNYHAYVFLGLASLELGEVEKGEQAYRKAIELSPDQLLAWQGISKLYERLKRWDKFAETLEQLMDLYLKAKDEVKCAEALQRFVQLRREEGSRSEIVSALKLYLPSSRYYDLLSNLPTPDPTAPTATTTYAAQEAIHKSLPILEEIVSLSEKGEEERIEQEVKRRRQRIGAGRPEEVRAEVGREVWSVSTLPSLYNEILNHPDTPDDLRRTVESKLLRHNQQYLFAVQNKGENKAIKDRLRREVEEMARGVVLLDIADELAWNIVIEYMDTDSIEGYDFGVLRRYIKMFSSPLAIIVQQYFRYMGLPTSDDYGGDDDGDPEGAPEVAQDKEGALDVILDVFASAQRSILAHRVLAEIYDIELDRENAIKVAEAGLELLGRSEADWGARFTQTRKAFDVILGTGLVHLFPPKHHLRALRILEDVLSIDTDNVTCLMGKGYIYQYTNKWSNAESLFARVVELVGPENMDVGLEAREERAWCQVRQEHFEDGEQALKAVIEDLDKEEGKFEQKARAWWRLGNCLSDADANRRKESYAMFITSLKRSSSFAPAFTSLGIYYLEHASPPDPNRASKCFQKAFELDAREADAARRLAEGFAEEREWDLVEVVARRTIEGEGGETGGGVGQEKAGGARYAPTNAWAWKAVGVVELSRQNYPAGIQAFQIALRADQDDFVSWSRLGEAYARSGRHVAALKALKRAQELRPDDWVCAYLTGDVQQQLGLYSTAVETFHGILEKRPDEIGVLAMLSETYLALGREEFATGFLRRAEGSFIDSITVAKSVIDLSAGFRRIPWKTASDAVLELSKTAVFNDPKAVGEALLSLAQLIAADDSAGKKKIAGLISMSQLMDQLGDAPEGLTALWLAVALFEYRATLGEDEGTTGSAHYDHAIVLHRLSMRVMAEEDKNSCLDQATDSIKQALREEPGNEAYWNALGAFNFASNPKIAQHAFIKALEYDSKDPVTWANLGFLYLHHGDTELANQTFYRTQTIDPDYSLAWVGQGLVAIANGHSAEARSLFEHAVSLSASVPEADSEFATRTFGLFSNHAASTPAAGVLFSPFFAMDRYCQQRPEDPSALHVFALICERLGQQELAIDLLQRAIAVLESAYEKTEDAETEMQFAIANANLGRIRVATSDFSGALDAFNVSLSLTKPDNASTTSQVLRAQAHFGSGLANFKLGDLESALAMFETALEETPVELQDVRGHITILLAQTLWAIGSDEARNTAKDQLLGCIASDPENLQAITTLAAIGTLLAADDLVDAALSEILALPLDRRHKLDPHRDVDNLLSQHHLGLGRASQATSVLQHAVHAEPSQTQPRKNLGTLLLKSGQPAAAESILLGTLGSQQVDDRQALHDSLRLSAVARVRAHERALLDEDTARLSQKEVERAVVLAPWEEANWVALAYVRSRAAGVE